MATLIGLCIRVKLLRALPPRFKVGPCLHGSNALLDCQQDVRKICLCTAGLAATPGHSEMPAAATHHTTVCQPYPCLCLATALQADIQLTPGSHASEAAVNKQLGDKERVAAALENPNLLQMVDRCLGSSL